MVQKKPLVYCEKLKKITRCSELVLPKTNMEEPNPDGTNFVIPIFDVFFCKATILVQISAQEIASKLIEGKQKKLDKRTRFDPFAGHLEKLHQLIEETWSCLKMMNKYDLRNEFERKLFARARKARGNYFVVQTV